MPSTSSPVGVPKSHLGVGDLELTRWWRIITALSPVVVFVSAHRNFVSVGGVEKKRIQVAQRFPGIYICACLCLVDHRRTRSRLAVAILCFIVKACWRLTNELVSPSPCAGLEDSTRLNRPDPSSGHRQYSVLVVPACPEALVQRGSTWEASDVVY